MKIPDTTIVIHIMIITAPIATATRIGNIIAILTGIGIIIKGIIRLLTIQDIQAAQEVIR